MRERARQNFGAGVCVLMHYALLIGAGACACFCVLSCTQHRLHVLGFFCFHNSYAAKLLILRWSVVFDDGVGIYYCALRANEIKQ